MLCKCTAFARPGVIFGLAVLASAAALATAYTSEFAFGLQPCIMCLYQRIPYAVIVVLGLIGLAVRNKPKAASLIIGLCALAFLADAGLAAYHSGVERHWWESAVEGCKVPMGKEGQSTKEWLAEIMKAPSVPCTQIQWQDPYFGLTMANYNLIYGFMLFLICVKSLAFRLCPSRSEDRTRPG